eukprot:9999736-Alexandrium_andersonii.AAC.1
MAFAPKLVTSAMSLLLRPEWGLSDTESTDWAETLSRRIRCACRHIQQSKIKQPRWFCNYFPEMVEASPAARSKASASAASI